MTGSRSTSTSVGPSTGLPNSRTGSTTAATARVGPSPTRAGGHSRSDRTAGQAVGAGVAPRRPPPLLVEASVADVRVPKAGDRRRVVGFVVDSCCLAGNGPRRICRQRPDKRDASRWRVGGRRESHRHSTEATMAQPHQPAHRRLPCAVPNMSGLSSRPTVRSSLRFLTSCDRNSTHLTSRT